ncbi:MAG: family 10 glycosylhydrolase [Alloprevotella sp.]|nr:family 10 glycosylhydrolase [Alloprevotella sp.]
MVPTGRISAQFSLSVPDSTRTAFPLPRAYRAVWFTTLGGLDWPAAPANNATSRSRQQADLCRQFDQLKEAGINTILFQTRLRGTVAYRSEIEPFDYVFAGKSCADPGYDPLAFAVEQAHRRGMELHAWVVAFPVCRLSDMKSLGAKALPRLHPELCYKSQELYLMDPGQPGTADYLARLCVEIASRYEVDGIHLDYIRYPENGIRFDDRHTYSRYGKGTPLKQWRRENVSHVVETVAEAVRAVRPDIRLSCSPVGKYDDTARYSSKGWNAFTAVCQDPVEWVEKGWMDVLFPMMYFDGDNFYPFLFDWKERVGANHIAPGLGLYQIDRREGNRTLTSLTRQTFVIEQQRLAGFAFFRTRFLLGNTKGCYDFYRGLYGQTAVLPPAKQFGLPEKPLPRPSATIRQVGHSLQFAWSPRYDADGHRLWVNIYRIDPAGPTLLQSRIEASTHRLEVALPQMMHCCYALTFYDRYGRESEPAFVGL